MKRLFTIIASLILAATGAFAFSPSLDGRAVVAEKGVLPPLATAAIPPLAFLCAIIMFYRTRDL